MLGKLCSIFCIFGCNKDPYKNMSLELVGGKTEVQLNIEEVMDIAVNTDDKMDAAGKTGTSQSFIDTDNDGVIDTETITTSFIGYAPFNSPKVSFMITSPNCSHIHGSTYDFVSLVNYRLTREVTKQYYEMFGL